jgi:hypothetical protein
MSINKKTIVNSEWDEIFNLYGDNNFTNHIFPLYLFTARLYDELSKVNCKDVLFMSREGQYLKTLFDRYLKIRKELKKDVINIKTHYFYGSRNSIMTASVNAIEEETFEHMFRFFNYFIKPKMFLFSIGFSEEQIEMVRKTFGKKLDKACINFKSSKVFKQLKKNATFQKIYEENRIQQRKAFGTYLDGFGIDYNADGLYFVDIGYHGTMQDLIFKYLNEKVTVRGYFLKSRANQTATNTKTGLLGDVANKKLFGSKINKYDSFNYEQILRADHGRCKGYELKGEKSTPIIDQKYKDGEIFNKYIKELQEQMLEKFDKIVRLDLSGEYAIDKICTLYFYHLVKNKTKANYDWILDMQNCHHDDFGYVGYPGRVFAMWLRRVAFKLKDKLFVLRNARYVRKLKKSIISQLNK